jgi:cytoskeletal protein CcmA (bactofilin family)
MLSHQVSFLESPAGHYRRQEGQQQTRGPRATGNLPKEIAVMDVPKTGEFAHIGKSVFIKGELSGSEDLYLDGQVEGNILLKGNNLTVGPNGQVKANVDAKGVIVQGKLEGNLHATDRVELRKSAIVTGDIATQRIAIEEGAYLKGKVDVGKDGK